MSVLQQSFLPLRRLSRLALMLALATALLGATFRDAEAQSRRRVGVAIGVGILGAIILNEAAREEAYQRRYYRQSEPRRAYRSSRKEQRYSEPAEKKQKVRSAAKSRSRSKPAQPAEEVAAAQPAAAQPSTEQETELPATQGTAATASPQPDNSYLPDADRKKAARTAAKPGDLPASNAAPTQALPQPAAGQTPDTISTPDEIKSAQEHLKYMGYDIPAATGTIDARTKAAFSAFQTSLGARPTGILTYDQLQTLFVKAADMAGGKAATRQR